MTGNKAPRRGLIHRPGHVSINLAKGRKTMKKLHHSAKHFQHPDLLDFPLRQDWPISVHRTRWVASRCRVSLATAETIIANAGFSDGEGRR